MLHLEQLSGNAKNIEMVSPPAPRKLTSFMIHQTTPISHAGLPLDEAKAAMILVHGRGASAPSILTLANEFKLEGFAVLAPQAYQNTWYPNSFLAPMEANQPGLDSGLAKIGSLVGQIEAAGIPAEKIMIGGFSQGACLSSEFVARNAKRYGGLFVLSGETKDLWSDRRELARGRAKRLLWLCWSSKQGFTFFVFDI